MFNFIDKLFIAESNLNAADDAHFAEVFFLVQYMQVAYILTATKQFNLFFVKNHFCDLKLILMSESNKVKNYLKIIFQLRIRNIAETFNNEQSSNFCGFPAAI